MTRRLFALERYEHSGALTETRPVSGLTSENTSLVAVVNLPADEVVLALVEAPDEATVLAAAAAAGWRVDRVTRADWIHPAAEFKEEPSCES